MRRRASADSLVERLLAPPVLVLGDLLLDEYVMGSVVRVSPEAPIPILRAERSEVRCGGAANVARNLAALGAPTRCAGSVGDDDEGARLLALLTDAGVDVAAIVRDPARPTAHKTRMMAHGQQILRVDRESCAPIGRAVERALLRGLGRAVDGCRLAVISDYAKGTLTPTVARALVRDFGSRGVPLLVGLKGRDCDKYRGATGAMLNRAELHELTGKRELERAAVGLRRALELRFLAVTLGDEGMLVCDARGCAIRTAERREVFDVTGAGDTALAAFALGFASGLALVDCAQLANAAAGVTVGRLGTAAVSRAAAGEALRRAAPSKLCDLDTLLARVEPLRARRRRIVLTNGCYDVLHAGHVQALEFARSRGDFLIVAVNTDRSVRELKGTQRPIVGEEQRARVLAALGCVDAVVLFDEPTPARLIARLRPDVLVKGADYRGRRVVGRDAVRRYGGRVELAPLVEGLSTSSLIERIRGRENGA